MKVDGVVPECICCECLSIIHWLFVSMFMRCYAYIGWMMVEVMICGQHSHALITG